MKLLRLLHLPCRATPAVLLGILGIITLLTAFMSLGLGGTYIGPVSIIEVLIGKINQYTFIVENYRLPRVMIAILSGAGLAISGAILQGMIRNPLASPDVIGITKGAGLAAVIVIVWFPSSPLALLPLAAFAGAALIAVVLMLMTGKSGTRPSTLALVGLALGAVCQAFTEFFLVKYPLHATDSLVWLTGSLWGRGWDKLFGMLPWIAVLIPLSLSCCRRLDLLSLGEDVAAGLGLQVKRNRILLLSVAVALAGVCVAVSGSIGFIGLLAPHMARRLVGSRHNMLIPCSAWIGAFLLVVADGLGRGLLPPVEIPAGILTAVIGAPYFLYLLRQESKRK